MTSTEITKVALVTGANRGIGLAIATELAKRGVKVAMACRTLAKAEQACQDLIALNPKAQVEAVELDLATGDHQSVVKQIVQKHGRLDILINNAGVFLDPALDPGESITLAEIPLLEQTLATNLFGPTALIWAALPIMIKQNYGRIVNVSSGMGSFTEMGAGMPFYRISKAALNVLTVTAAKDVAEYDIKVNSVCPGWVKTSMGGPTATRSVEKGAETIVWAALLDKNGLSGKFFRDFNEIGF